MVRNMGIVLLLILGGMEIALSVWTRKKAREKKDWHRNRLISRGIQFGVICIAILLPIGQKWRIKPALFVFLLLLVIAGVIWLVRRKRSEGEKKTSGVIVSLVLNILLILFLLVPVFLFSGYKGLGTTGEYEVAQASAILVDESRIDPFETDGSSREIPVHFYYPVVSEEENALFPLVVFSHGAFGYYESNFSTYQELASNGYVVAALDHPHHAFFTHDTDGNLIIVDPNFIQTAIEVSAEEDYEETELRAVEEDWMNLRVPDLNFAMDSIESAAKNRELSSAWTTEDPDEERVLDLLQLIDTGKIGVMGHSMGGATSVEAGRLRDDIGAVIDIDGTMLGEYINGENGSYTVRTEPYTVPILEFVNWNTYQALEEVRNRGIVYPNDVLIKNANEGFSVTIQDTEHMDFTDLPLLSPSIGKMLGSGERDVKETMSIVNSLILDFFNSYLKDEGTFQPQEVY